MDEDVSATDAAQEDEADLTSFNEYRVDSGSVNQSHVGLSRLCGNLSGLFCFHVHFSEVFHQQAVDKDASATDTAQEDQVNAVVEEGDESPREEVYTNPELSNALSDHSFACVESTIR